MPREFLKELREKVAFQDWMVMLVLLAAQVHQVPLAQLDQLAFRGHQASPVPQVLKGTWGWVSRERKEKKEM